MSPPGRRLEDARVRQSYRGVRWDKISSSRAYPYASSTWEVSEATAIE